MPSIKDRIAHAWNAFTRNEDFNKFNPDLGMSYSYRPDAHRPLFKNEKSIVNAIYNRIAIDCASMDILHAKVDDNGQYEETINSKLHRCLSRSANIDESGRELIQDIVESVCEEGRIAVVPVETTINPDVTAGYDINQLRVGSIIAWYPESVKVRLYNEKTGNKEEIVVSKKYTAIINNPFYSVMNEPNSTVQRLIRKLSILDVIDEQSGAGKLDLIIQLPYVIKSDARREQAEKRRKDIEMQLAGSKYGIAYTDGTEHITQLNRPVENNLMSQIEYLTSMLFSQLGMSENVFKGCPSEQELTYYQNGTIQTMLLAVTEEMERKWITENAYTRGERILFIKDPFRNVAASNLAEMADKFTRNEIVTSNEFRAVLGMKPSDDPKADELRNKNINQSAEEQIQEPYNNEDSKQMMPVDEEVKQSAIKNNLAEFLSAIIMHYDSSEALSMIEDLHSKGILDHFDKNGS